MIIDAHMHVFPFLGTGYGGRDDEEHLRNLQRFVAVAPAQAVRRLSDNRTEEDKSKWSVWDEQDPSPSGALDVGFRVGKFGRLIWTKAGVDYYLHLYAPNLQDMVAAPDFLVAQMNYAGVDRGILQNAWLYGSLNDYIADAVASFPDRFVGTVQVNESVADHDDQLRELKRGVKELGLKALYYANARFFETGYVDHFDDGKFDEFWSLVNDFGVPVFWDITAIQEPDNPGTSPYERFLIQMRRFRDWKVRYPEVPAILVHGVPLRYIRQGDRFEPIPDELWEVWAMPNVYLEVLFPMQASHPVEGGSIWDYPYREVYPIIEQLYGRLGANRLVWGSDMPNTERNATYRQSRQYLESHCDFLTDRDKELLFSGNIADLFGLTS